MNTKHALLLLLIAPVIAEDGGRLREIIFNVHNYGQVRIDVNPIDGRDGTDIEIMYNGHAINYRNTDGVQPRYEWHFPDIQNGVLYLYIAVRHPGNGGHRSVLKYSITTERVKLEGQMDYTGRYGQEFVNTWHNEEPAQRGDAPDPEANATPALQRNLPGSDDP